MWRRKRTEIITLKCWYHSRRDNDYVAMRQRACLEKKSMFGKGDVWKRGCLEKSMFGKEDVWKRGCLEKGVFGKERVWKRAMAS